MKLAIFSSLVILIAVVATALYLRFGGVTHERIAEKLDDRAEEILNRSDEHYSALDKKLDRIESKLDRLLQIADRPFPDGLSEVK